MPNPTQVSVSGLSPSSLLSGGNYGLVWTQYKESIASISGTGLTNGLPVTVNYPLPPANPTIQWLGQTANTNVDNTSCTVTLTQNLQTNGPSTLGAGKTPAPGGLGDTNANVSVIVGNPDTPNGAGSAQVWVYLGTSP
jgi:hypothetical protein